MRRPTATGYHERLTVPWWWWPLGLGIVAVLAAPFAMERAGEVGGVPGPLRPLAVAVVPITAVVLWWLGRIQVAVRGEAESPVRLASDAAATPVRLASDAAATPVRLASDAAATPVRLASDAAATPVRLASDAELLVDDARLPVRFIAAVVPLDEAGRRELLGASADPLAFVVQRPWIRGAVQVVLDDPADPTPYWLVSTRHPERLAGALRR